MTVDKFNDFIRSWSGSNDIENIEKFFSVEHGSIVTTEAICLTNQVDIATYSKKKFVEPFVNAVKALHLVSDKDENMRILEFKRFINEFGTHYASTSEMGTKLSIGTAICTYLKYGHLYSNIFQKEGTQQRKE